MQLITAHKILISFAIAFFLLFGIREIVMAKDVSQTMVGIAGLLGAVAFGFYLRYVFRTNPKQEDEE